MRYLPLALLAAVAIFIPICLQRAEGQTPPFAITSSYCHICEGTSLDWSQDQVYWEASGNLRTFIWASPYSQTIGVRRAQLSFEGLGVAYMVTATGFQRLVGPGDVCLAYSDGQRPFIVIRGFGQARATFDDGINNGCW